MEPLLPHEEPLLVALPRGRTAAEGLRAFLDRPEVRGYTLPAPWYLEAAGVDLAAALPDVRTVTPENLGRVLEASARACTREVLERRCRRLWLEADERVRQHFLQRGALAQFAGIFRLGPRSVELPPPPEFVADRVHEHRFEIQYRLSAERGSEEYLAPPEEGSVAVYPFDPEGRLVKQERGLADDGGPILEAFAYVWQHERHRALWSSVAADLGGRLL